MALTISEVKSKSDLKKFIDLPWKLYHHDKNWVPPLKLALNDLFKKEHPVWKTSTIKSWLALRDGNPVGRISAVVCDSHNKFHEENTGFFGFYDAVEDDRVTRLLFKTAEEYLRGTGVNKIQGPFNPTTNYECGTLIEGFDDPPQLMMTYNPRSHVQHIEGVGYTKAKDLVAYTYPISKPLPDKILRVAARAEKSNNITYRSVNLKNWNQEIELMLEIYNSAWEKNWGFIPMTPEEFRHTAKDLKSIVNPDLVIFVMVGGEVAGFVVTLPDFNQILKKIPNGKLLPTGIFKILTGRKSINRVRIITLGIKAKFRNLGLASLLYKQTQVALQKYPQYKEAEFSWILEDNYNMNNPLLLMGAEVYKKYRIFEKSLNS